MYIGFHKREIKSMTHHTSSIQQACLYPKRYNMMFVPGSMVLQLNKLHFHHVPSTQHQEAKPGMGSTLHVMCWVTTTTNATHGADECKINLHWVRSLIFTVKMFVHVFEFVIFLYKIFFLACIVTWELLALTERAEFCFLFYAFPCNAPFECYFR